MYFFHCSAEKTSYSFHMMLSMYPDFFPARKTQSIQPLQLSVYKLGHHKAEHPIINIAKALNAMFFACNALLFVLLPNGVRYLSWGGWRNATRC